MSVERYVIYNGKSEYPDAGTYDVHIGIQGSDKETVIKNVSVKKSSSMPTINNSGTKSLSVSRREVCALLKPENQQDMLYPEIFSNITPSGQEFLFIQNAMASSTGMAISDMFRTEKPAP